jgi:O-antigen ligase
LLAAGLLGLQISLGSVRLVNELPAFALVGLAALVGCVSIRSTARADFLCLAAAAVFCGYIAVRALSSPSAYYARADLYSLLAAVTVYGVTATVFTAAGKRIALILVLLGVAICHVVVCLVQYGVGENLIFVSALRSVEETTRPTGLHAGSAYLAGFLEVVGIFGLSIACWSRWPKWGKVLIGYVALVCYVGVALTGSRGGYLSVLASLTVSGLLSLIALRAGGGALFWRWGIGGVIGLAALVWAGASLMQQSSWFTNRLQNIVAVDQEAARFDLWHAAAEQWKVQPWTGTGSGTYRFYGRQFRAERMQQDPVMVHNDYLHLLSEYGLVGAATFVIFLLAHLSRGWLSFRFLGPQRLASGAFPLSDRLALNVGAIGAIGAYVVHSAVDFNLHIPANALLLAFVFGLIANPGFEAAESDRPTKFTLWSKVAVAAVAAILLVECVRLLPGEYYVNRARIALEDEDPTAAISFATRALRWEKKNPRIHFYLGRSYSAIGDDKVRSRQRNSYYERALAAFDRARLLNPLDGSHALDMAILYDRMGRFGEAEWMYGLALERDPRSVPFNEQYRSHLRLWERSGG